MTETYTQGDVLRVRSLATIRSSKINLDNIAKVFNDDEASFSELYTAVQDLEGVARTLTDLSREVQRTTSAAINGHLGDLPEGDEEK